MTGTGVGGSETGAAAIGCRASPPLVAPVPFLLHRDRIETPEKIQVLVDLSLALHPEDDRVQAAQAEGELDRPRRVVLQLPAAHHLHPVDSLAAPVHLL